MDLKALQELLGHQWLSTTSGYIHVRSDHIERAWTSANQRVAARFGERELNSMLWNLRLKAAERGIWKSAQMRRLLADAGLDLSAGKMSVAVGRDPGHDPPGRPGRHLRGAGLRPRGAADPRARQGRGPPARRASRPSATDAPPPMVTPRFGNPRSSPPL